MLVLKPDGTRGSLWADSEGNILTTTDPNDATDLPGGAVLAQYLSASGVALKINAPAGWGTTPPPSLSWYSRYDLTDTTKLWTDAGRTVAAASNGDRVAVVDDLEAGNHSMTFWDSGDSSTRPHLGVEGGPDIYVYTGGGWRGLTVADFSAKVDARLPFWIAAAVRIQDSDTGASQLFAKDQTWNDNLRVNINLTSGTSTSVDFIRTLQGVGGVTATANSTAIGTSGWAVVSFGYTGDAITVRVNKGTKASSSDTRSIPVGSVFPLRFGQGDFDLEFSAVGLLDEYPDSTVEDLAIEAIGTMAGLTL